MILDGKKLAAEILARTKARAGSLGKVPRVVAYIAGEGTPITQSYLKIKERSAAEAGCVFEVVSDLASFAPADAVIVQLPLPPEVDVVALLNTIPTEKDADVLSMLARMRFEAGESGAIVPPVAGAVAEILKVSGVNPRAKKAVVIGIGWLVGKPCAEWLMQQGADVSHITLESGDLSILKDADIIVSGAGSPHLIQPEMIKEGVVLIDAGTSESSGRIVGDAHPSCADRCSLFTPVPGGVGPVAVAKLFENAVELAARSAVA